jgi:very-short-patch-repair endonuclease
MRGAQPWRTNRARALRSQHVSAEEKLWSELRHRRLGGFKFVRQAPVGPYFADFLCRQRKLIVEVDGGTHSTQSEMAADAHRMAALNAMGFRVVRVHNAEVFANIDGVCSTLLGVLQGRTGE